MTTELITRLTALLAHFDKLADSAARKLEDCEQPTQGAFYAGVMFGMETARDDLAEALASAMMETAKP